MAGASRAGGRIAAVLVTVVLSAALAGCGDGSAAGTTSMVTTTVSTTASASSTATTALVTTTTAATTTTMETEVWDVVALGDSLVAGYGVRNDEAYTPEEAFPGVYARSLGEQLGVETVLHSYFPSQTWNDVRTVAEWNEVLASDEEMRADLRGAEVVIVWLGTHNLVPAMLFSDCGGIGWPDPMRACLQEATETMPADFDGLLGTIENLVPEGAVVMIGNQGVAPRWVEDWGTQSFWPELKVVAFDGWWQGIETAAAAHGAIVVHSAEALNGPDGNLMPPPEFVLPDELHMTAAGHRFLADLFLAADGLGD